MQQKIQRAAQPDTWSNLGGPYQGPYLCKWNIQRWLYAHGWRLSNVFMLEHSRYQRLYETK